MSQVLENYLALSAYTEQFRYVPQESPLAWWPVPLCTSFTYLALVYLTRRAMEGREAFKLRWWVVTHNFIMTTISAVVFAAIGWNLFFVAARHGWDMEVLFCDSQQAEVGTGSLYFWIYLFYLSKYYELLDTFQLILRKKPFKFLHAYHHWATLILCYVCLEVQMPVQWIAQWLNAAVHVPMYYYYLLTVLGVKNIWWKKYITMMQIVQFVLVDGFHLFSFFWHYYWNGGCSSFDTWGNQFGFAIINSYLLLFVDFYIQTYKRKKN